MQPQTSKVLAIAAAAFIATIALLYIASATTVFTTPSRRLPFTLRGIKVSEHHEHPGDDASRDYPAKTGHDPWLTAQACSLLADESELCDYKGPVCLSLGGGGEATLFVSHSKPDMEFDPRDWWFVGGIGRGRAPSHLATHVCQWLPLAATMQEVLETSWPCGYGADVTRPNLDVRGGSDPTVFRAEPQSRAGSAGAVLGPRAAQGTHRCHPSRGLHSGDVPSGPLAPGPLVAGLGEQRVLRGPACAGRRSAEPQRLHTGPGATERHVGAGRRRGLHHQPRRDGTTTPGTSPAQPSRCSQPR